MNLLLRETKSICRNRRTFEFLAKRTCTSTQLNIPESKDVPGLSSNVVSVPPGEVKPEVSKNSTYKNPEYFCYNNTSYFEAEIEMLKYRLPQPSNKKQQ